MQRVAQHDHAAFALLVERHVDALYRYALRLSGASASAEDLVQDTWLAVWRDARRFSPKKARVTTWLHRILHNKFIDGVRKRSRESLDEPPEQAAGDPDLGDQADGARRYAELQERLNRLPEQQRAALLLAHAQGLSNPEIASILGRGVRAVESLLARARRTIKSEMQSFEDD